MRRSQNADQTTTLRGRGKAHLQPAQEDNRSKATSFTLRSKMIANLYRIIRTAKHNKHQGQPTTKTISATINNESMTTEQPP